MDRMATGREKLRCVGEQCLAAKTGEDLVLACPYCGGETKHGGTFCCVLLMTAVKVLLDAQEQLEVVATMDEIIDRHMRHANN